jgi:hypothetical protein
MLTHGTGLAATKSSSRSRSRRSRRSCRSSRNRSSASTKTRAQIIREGRRKSKVRECVFCVIQSFLCNAQECGYIYIFFQGKSVVGSRQSQTQLPVTTSHFSGVLKLQQQHSCPLHQNHHHSTCSEQQQQQHQKQRQHY